MNFIVYKTTNLINGKIYIGVHYTNPDIFDGYIGCGVKSTSITQNIKGFRAAVLKYGYENFKRQTLFTYEDSESGMLQAYKKEAELVNKDFLKRTDVYNLALGGKFTLNYNRRRSINQYDLNGNYIKTWDSIQEAEQTLNLTAINDAVELRSRYCGNFQWRYNDGTTDNIQPTETKEKSVYQFDLQGNLIKCWKSDVEASHKFNNPDAAKTAIGNVCNKRARQAYGYYWSFKCKFEYEAFGSAVAKYDDDGHFLESYSSIAEAGIKNGMPKHNNIGAAIKGTQKRCGGFRWRYFYGNTDDINPLTR